MTQIIIIIKCNTINNKAGQRHTESYQIRKCINIEIYIKKEFL